MMKLLYNINIEKLEKINKLQTNKQTTNKLNNLIK